MEFLLVNHPLDCPVCDKGGECPLQDISYGWGGGKSRFIEPKRHFRKPLELSPLVAIDRERCILCYRCVRFSQEVAEDYQLVFLERGDHTYVGTHDGRPYVGPFSGNIVELCPVGALTSTAYRFRARPWDIEGAGSLCTLCPSQCNVTFTVRDDAKVLRVLARENPDVDDGWLCDKGRFGYQAIHSAERVRAPMVRDGGALREVSWERALEEAAGALSKAGPKTAALAGGGARPTRRLFAAASAAQGPRIAPPGLPHGGSDRGRPGARSGPPDLSARVSDIDHAGAVLIVETELVDEAPILDLRVRKAARRHGTKVVALTSRPSALDPNASAHVRFAPGATEAALGALAAALGSGRAPGRARRGGRARRRRARRDGRGRGEVLRGRRRRGDPVGRARLPRRAAAGQAVEALLAVASALGVRGSPRGGPDRGARRRERPRPARGRRGSPNLGPGLSDPPETGMGAGAGGRALSPPAS